MVVKLTNIGVRISGQKIKKLVEVDQREIQ